MTTTAWLTGLNRLHMLVKLCGQRVHIILDGILPVAVKCRMYNKVQTIKRKLASKKSYDWWSRYTVKLIQYITLIFNIPWACTVLNKVQCPTAKSALYCLEIHCAGRMDAKTAYSQIELSMTFSFSGYKCFHARTRKKYVRLHFGKHRKRGKCWIN